MRGCARNRFVSRHVAAQWWGDARNHEGPPGGREWSMADKRQASFFQSAAELARRTVGMSVFTALNRSFVRPFVRSFVRSFRVPFAVEPRLSSSFHRAFLRLASYPIAIGSRRLVRHSHVCSPSKDRSSV